MYSNEKCMSHSLCDSKTNEKRHFEWRTETREECEKWVEKLEQHRKTLLAKRQFLARNPDAVFN